MQYKEFLNILDTMAEGQKVYFKPFSDEPLNAYHPDVKNRIFQLTIEPDGRYKLCYIKLIEGIILPKDNLKKMFNLRHWENYIPFDLFEDYQQWHTDNQNS